MTADSLTAVAGATIHPLSLGDQVVGLAFHCGMGASTNRVMTGFGASGRAIAVLADLELLDAAR